MRMIHSVRGSFSVTTLFCDLFEFTGLLPLLQSL
jgi:hypothetical protein